MAAIRRLDVISQHLTGIFDFSKHDPTLDAYRKRGANFNSQLLHKVMNGNASEVQDRITERYLTSPYMRRELMHDKTRHEIQELVMRQIISTNPYRDVNSDIDLNNPEIVYAAAIPLTGFDMALSARFIIHFSLYLDSLRELGTEKHLPLIDRAYRHKDHGCFAMTELGHGSNVNGFITTATYDHKTREIVFHTPDSMGAKWWIGGLGKTANMAIVHAKLVVGGVDHGIHAFAVQVRDYDTHSTLPGITIGDCGPKTGLDGIDNGFLLFNQHRAPYDTLLDRYSHITPEGKFKSNIKNDGKRFGLMLASLIRGRSGVMFFSSMNMKNALTIAVRYSAVRRQFGKEGEPERPVLDYQIHRYRLMKHLSNWFSVQIVLIHFINEYKVITRLVKDDPEHPTRNEFHAQLSAMKVLCSSMSLKACQDSREACGGLGFSAYSNLGRLRDNQDVNITWEGANYVLIQQTARYILKNIQNILKGKPVEAASMTFLTIDPEVVRTAKATFVTSADLRDKPETLQAMLKHRVNYLVQRSIVKLQDTVQHSSDSLEGWNESQVHYLQNLGFAYGDLFFADLFLRKCKEVRAACQETSAMLMRLYELFTLGKIEEDLNTFRDNDYISTEQAWVIKETVVALTREVGESAVRLIDAVAFPDQMVGSVLGNSDGQIYRHMCEAVEQGPGVTDKPAYLELLQQLRKIKE